ncbi:hypothetical protein AWB69_08048 [Caballeronia udeis]|uniref:KTSC domain-containing protein n=2 Tax=Caballeronia udeis TaxID=1232866 RepID=A0A158JJE5_9BURK|nr:hypothetical protein AWB69_08048 [Caballeronia udeis]
MQRYDDPDENSTVIGYEIFQEAIRVYFRDGSAYLYNYFTPRPEKVERLKLLAVAGDGLHTYIAQAVRHRYAMKIR